MRKVFISMPMRYKTNKEIKCEIKELTELAKTLYGCDCEIIDSFMEGAPYNKKPLWFLGKSLQFLSDADCAIFAKGWEKARGCKIEHIAAEEYGIEIYDVKEYDIKDAL